MSCHKYVVTAQKPTATHFSVKGAFTNPNDLNLVLGKGTRVEIYTLTPDGLKPTLEFGIYGTIVSLLLFTPRDRDRASLFLLTARRKYCVLTFTDSLITEASGEIGMPGYSCLESMDLLGIMDPTGKCFAANIYESIITIIVPELFAKHKETLAVSRRSSLRNRDGRKRQIHTPQDHMSLCVPDKKIVSMAFLDGMDEPTLVILYDDALSRRCLQTFTIDLRARELVAGEVLMNHFEPDANVLIAMPAPVGGVIVISSMYIRYVSQHQPPKAIGIKSSTINTYSIMNDDGSRILLGDAEGRLHMLMLEIRNNNIDALWFIGLGRISVPSCLAYLGNDVAFVGSTCGDSQLVHMRSADNFDSGQGDALNVIEEFPNLGPITDFCIADLDKKGQGQLITCSGAAQNSSLRIVRSGVGMNKVAAIEISGVKGIWALRPSFHEKYNDMLVISFVNQTHLLQIKDNEMKQLSHHAGFALDQRTLGTANVKGDLVLQVTASSVRLMQSRTEGHLLDEWFPDPQCQISVTSINPTQCVVSIGYGRLVALQVKDRRLAVIGHTQLEHEISCLDIHPTDPQQPDASTVVAVGVWQKVGVLLLALPSLDVIADEPLAGTAMPRSMLMTTFEGVCYLLVALGDGQFYNFRLDTTLTSCADSTPTRKKKLWDKKRSFLGKLPISLAKFTSNGTTHVFAASDKPSVIHSRNQKLIYSNVNLKEVRCVTSFHSSTFPDAVALTTKDGLIIGQMEEIQKLHITKIATKDTPRRIVFQESSRTFGVVTEKLPLAAYTAQTTTGGFEILDDQTFTVLDRIYFNRFERPLSATSIVFDKDKAEYYAVATGRDSDAFETTSQGRIILLRVTPERKLVIVSQVATDGMVELVRSFQGKLLASFHSQLHVYELEYTSERLHHVCSHPIPSITESVAIHDELVIVGDMVYSTVALRYDEKERVFEELASDEIPREITALEAMNSSLYIAAEKEGHLLVMERRDESNEDQEPLIETVSQWHLGELVQRIRVGSLRMSNPDPDSKPAVPSLIFAAASGAIGMIVDLSEERFKLLWQMQHNMTKVVRSIGDLSHADWRCLSMMSRRDKSMNFIDGDLIESFLDLTPQQMQEVVEGKHGGKKLDLTVEDLCKVVEELMSVHS